MDSLWCTLQDKVNIMGCIAAGGPWRHPWPPSRILLKIQICRENCKYVLLEMYNVIELNVLLLLETFYMFFHWTTVKNTHFYSKMAWPHATYDILSRYHSNRLSPNLTKMCLKVNEQLLKTAYANNKCCWRNRRKTLWGLYVRGLNN